MTKRLQAGLCGYGGLGHVHAGSLAAMEDVDLVAVCDIDPAKLAAPAVATNLDAVGKAFDIRRARTYGDFAGMLRQERLDVIVTALPSDLHAEYAIAALQSGCHVFTEKPMALSSGESRRMADAAVAAGRLLMVGQCLRFWGEYRLLLEMVRDRRYGLLKALYMERVGNGPGWGSWFSDPNRSGGAILDLHLHDADWCLHAFGWPETIAAGGCRGATGGIDDVTAVWTYRDGLVVTLRGSWMAGAFRMTFQALFETACVEFGPGGGLTVIPRKGDRETIQPKPQGSAYFEEMRYFLDCVRNGRDVTVCTPESTIDSVRAVELEKTAIEARRVVVCADERREERRA